MQVLLLLILAAVGPCLVSAAPVGDQDEPKSTFVEDEFGNYQMSYDWSNEEGGAFQREVGDVTGKKVGAYGLRYGDGTVRVVSYIADEEGFRASIYTNEPGTVPSSPAHAIFLTPAQRDHSVSTATSYSAAAFPTFPDVPAAFYAAAGFESQRIRSKSS
ncbi:adult-specific rigid cuticular protein 15.5-like [Ornithodoros turicata]|uniref:adult-specific rigid cuticular protein 15.5-like n=1 Tax=Ornithodoros turicata TaxID=34597 RepID=UPI003138B8E9